MTRQSCVRVEKFRVRGQGKLSEPVRIRPEQRNAILLLFIVISATSWISVLIPGTGDAIPESSKAGEIPNIDAKYALTENVPPQLTGDGVNPTSGYTNTNFSFYVIYSDQDNDQPFYIRLNLSGTLYSMSENDTADTNYSDGKAYHVRTLIQKVGTFYFNFTASDGVNSEPVTTATKSIKVDNRAPSRPILFAQPSTAFVNQTIVFYATSSDPDNDTLRFTLYFDYLLADGRTPNPNSPVAINQTEPLMNTSKPITIVRTYAYSAVGNITQKKK